MSTATTTSFLEGQGIAVDLPNIEDELAKLWGPAAQQAGGLDAQTPNVTRVVLANLVVECLDSGGELLGPVLETVMARFPCRAIVVCGSSDHGRRISAEVSALCHLPAPGLPQVCSERIVLRTGPSSIDLVPGAVRPLLETDLPLLLWWTSDPRRHEAVFRDMADECSRLVLDLPDPGAEAGALRLGLDPNLCACSRDSAWLGLAPWRELVAQFFDPLCHQDRLRAIVSVQLEVQSPDPTRPARLAVWLASWLAGQLGWQPQIGSLKQGQRSAQDGELQARFRGPSGDIELSIMSRRSAGVQPGSTELVGVTITTRGTGAAGKALDTFRLRRPTSGSSSVVIDAETAQLCRLPRVVDAPELDAARRVAASLESSRADRPFQRSLPIALWLLEGGASGSS
jgi:glucose-6-phosphate dehydrogenase assembly protein OpcA